MDFYVLTLFPDMIRQGLGTSIIGRATESGRIQIHALDIRDYTLDKHGKVDDYPYGGGAGMLMQAQPVYDAWKAVTGQIWEKEKQKTECHKTDHLKTDNPKTDDSKEDDPRTDNPKTDDSKEDDPRTDNPKTVDSKEDDPRTDNPKMDNATTNKRKPRTIYVTPQGTPFTQNMARELALEPELIFLCGHYEGIDERVLEETVTDYVSIGDYVLTGGELPAMVMIDAVSRLVPGVLNNDTSAETETFHNDLLEYPQYSRPEIWHEKRVPPVLLSGNHRKITQWRLEQSVERTARIRPDLYHKYQEKQQVISRLEKKKRNRIHMIEALKRGTGEILFLKGDTILIWERKSGAYIMSAADEEAAREMIDKIPEEAKLFVASQELFIELLKERFGASVMIHCVQACYTRREALPVKHKDIRLLGEGDADYIAANYHYGDKAYILGRLQDKVMYGAYAENKLIGFIGIHDDGGIGLLFVEEQYRHQGIGASLESYLINKRKELGETPYVQVVTDNLVSLRMQEQLGLNISKEALWWFDR